MKCEHLILLASMGLAALLHGPSPALAQVSLRSAQSFGVLGTSTVTNTGLTTITGDLGVSPGTAITGFPPGIVIGGSIHAGDAVAAQAHSDAALAYAALVAARCTTNLTGQVLGNLGTVPTLRPGVYCFNSSAQLTGTLNLVGGGPWIFQIGSTLTTASGSSVLVNGAQNCNGTNVFWQVGSSATIGTATQFVGNILALISITLNANANVSGNALALTGAVTMDTNQVSVCNAGGGAAEEEGQGEDHRDAADDEKGHQGEDHRDAADDERGHPHGAINVTGGGQIPVPDPDNAAPNATGKGRATFGFNAKPSNSGGMAASGEFSYVNHVTGLHINGPVIAIEVIAINSNGSPKTVRFSGTCDGNLPSCSFSVTVEDNSEPGGSDQFGIAVTGGPTEVRSQRVISNGNIQFQGK
jgi:Ice-binding-like